MRLHLAVQLAPRRWQSGLRALAAAVESGQELETAVATHQRALPGELRALITEALRVPQPTQFVLQAVSIRRGIQRDWQQFARLMTYPLLLLALTLVVGGLLSYLLMGSTEFSLLGFYESVAMLSSSRELDLIRDQAHAVVGLTVACGWTVLTLLTVRLLGPRWAWGAVVGGMLLIGRPLRWIWLREILQRYQLVMSQGISLHDAAEAVTRSFAHSQQAVAAAAIAQRIAAGVPLGQALSTSLLSDGLSRPALRLLDLRSAELPQALAETAELLGSLTEQRCRGLALLLPTFSIFFIGSLIWATFSIYVLAFMPVVSMFTSLA